MFLATCPECDTQMEFGDEAHNKSRKCVECGCKFTAISPFISSDENRKKRKGKRAIIGLEISGAILFSLGLLGALFFLAVPVSLENSQYVNQELMLNKLLRVICSCTAALGGLLILGIGHLAWVFYE